MMISKAIGWCCLSAGMAVAQAVSSQGASTAAKPLAFDVVSIRENRGLPGGPQEMGPTADGFRSINVSLVVPLLTGYVPQDGGAAIFMPDRISGLPGWAQTERYDVTAKIGEENMAEWQKPAAQRLMLQAMLQNLLIDRCKLAVHRETKEGPVYFLVLAKDGPKFKASNPAEEHQGMQFPFGGGVMAPAKDGLSLLDAPMTSVTSMMSMFLHPDRPILDRTGLNGRYDVTLPRVAMGQPSARPEDVGGASDPGPTTASALQSLGLKLEPGKATVETLVIDHLERPSAN